VVGDRREDQQANGRAAARSMNDADPVRLAERVGRSMWMRVSSSPNTDATASYV